MNELSENYHAMMRKVQSDAMERMILDMLFPGDKALTKSGRPAPSKPSETAKRITKAAKKDGLNAKEWIAKTILAALED